MTQDALKLNVKKFIPKIRAPYLMQEEVIKQKELAENTSPVISGQLAVKKESIGSQAGCGNTINTVNFHDEVLLLTGLQKKIAHFFVRRCIERNKNETGIITSEMLSAAGGTTQQTIKKILERMLEKNLFRRLKGKPGKGGFSIFLLDEDFIKVVRLQLEMESDFMAKNAGYDKRIVKERVNSLPSDWNNIDLTLLMDVFRSCKSENTQFFGKNQLKLIYNAAGEILSCSDVQNSINAFAFGLKKFEDQDPYKKLNNPAAVLFDTLKNGEKWEEKRYLSQEEESLYDEYSYLSDALQKNIKNHYEEWKNIDKDEKYKFYQKKIRSNEFYSDRIFEEKAWEDYRKNLWENEKNKILINTMGINENLLNKFKILSKDKS